MRALVERPEADFASMSAAAISDLDVRRANYEPGELVTDGTSASVPVTERLEIAGIGAISIPTTLHLDDRGGRWLVAWSPATIERSLRGGRRLSLQVTWAARAPILGAGDQPLTTNAPMVVIGLEGNYVKDPSSLTSALVAAGATNAEVSSALVAARANPTYFEPVFEVSRSRYEQLKPTLYPLPGTVFQATSARTAVTPGLAAHLVGSVGPITAEELTSLGAPYDATSTVGQTGLEQVYERQLAGTPGALVSVVDAAGATVAVVATLPPRPGRALHTTIDPSVQQAAEEALSGVSKPAALVAVQASTGAVLASVSDPASEGFDQALDGTFPPGSTFKVVTSTALIERGLGPASPASCPTSITVGGEVFGNAEGESPVSDLLHAFAESCNTAFIELATRNLTMGALPRTAREFRIGATPMMGIAAFGGSVPTPRDAADLAATAIGQGRVLVSPLDMAMVAASVASGSVRAARLVAGAPDDAVAAAPLPASVLDDLRQMMAEVVAVGTAAHEGLPGGTFAKTGTAEYGTGNPLPTDAWLIGWRGDVAFAMVEVGGGLGGPTDGPIAARFLDLLAAK